MSHNGAGKSKHWQSLSFSESHMQLLLFFFSGMIVKAVIFLSAWANLRIDSWDRTAGGMRSEAQGLNSKRFRVLGYEMPAE